MSKAPIAFFAYKRPEHTRQALESLSRCDGADESELFIFCDGPKGSEDKDAVEEVRNFVKSRKWCGVVNVIEREENWGLAKSITTGVTEIINKYGTVIVLEDDLVVHPKFLEYMNAALEKYEKHEDVFSITGYSYTADSNNVDDTYFLKLTSSWSWATWKNRWKCFDKNAEGWQELRRNERLRQLFNFDNVYDYFHMIEDQMNGKIDSWAILWYWTVFKRNGVTLYPKISLVRNIGFDGSGVHCGKMFRKEVEFNNKPLNINLTDQIYEKSQIRKMVVEIIKDVANKKEQNVIRRVIKQMFFK